MTKLSGGSISGDLDKKREGSAKTFFKRKIKGMGGECPNHLPYRPFAKAHDANVEKA